MGGRGFRRGLGVALAGVMALGAVPAFAADEAPRLVKVTAPTDEMIHELEESYDVGYLADHTEAAVYVTDVEEAQLRALGYTIGDTVEDESTWEARKAEIAATKAAEAAAAEFAEEGVDKSKARGAVPPPGETVVMRAYTFTNYAGRFLYVEAHNKANTTTGGPTQALSYAGPDGVYQPAVNMGKFVDGGAYMYHRQLVSLRGAYANIAAKDVTVRVAAATGATDTVKPIEWTGSALPPRIATFQKDFITKYMDPTEVYDRIDKIAARTRRSPRWSRCRTTRRATSARRWRCWPARRRPTPTRRRRPRATPCSCSRRRWATSAATTSRPSSWPARPARRCR